MYAVCSVRLLPLGSGMLGLLIGSITDMLATASSLARRTSALRQKMAEVGRGAEGLAAGEE
jgi:hypothetical protein